MSKNNFGELAQLLTELTSDGKYYRVIIKEWRDKRSVDQNSLLWMWLGEISKQARVNGQEFSAEIWHEYFKKYYCPEKQIRMPAGEPVTTKSTKLLDTGEMTHYLSRIEQWAQDRMFTLTTPINSEYREMIERQER